MPNRSASPSVARPTAAFFASTASRKRTQIFFGDVRSGAVEQHVAIGPQGLHVDAVRRERAIQVSRAAAVQSVCHDAEFCVAYGLEIYQLREALEIGIARIDFFEGLVVRLGRRALAELGRARLDVARHFRERRAAIGAGKFQVPDIRRDCGWP